MSQGMFARQLEANFANLCFVASVWRGHDAPQESTAGQLSLRKSFETLRTEFVALEQCVRAHSGYRWNDLVEATWASHFKSDFEETEINASLSAYSASRQVIMYDAFVRNGEPDATMPFLPFVRVLGHLFFDATSLRIYSAAAGEQVEPISLTAWTLCSSRLAPEAALALRAPGALLSVFAENAANYLYANHNLPSEFEDLALARESTRVLSELRDELSAYLAMKMIDGPTRPIGH